LAIQHNIRFDNVYYIKGTNRGKNITLFLKTLYSKLFYNMYY